MSGLRVVSTCPCQWRGRWFLLLARLTHRDPWHRCVLLAGHEGRCACRCGRRLGLVR